METAINNLSKLTFTRFVAAMMVVAFHFGKSFYPFNGDNISGRFLQGPIAVQYFFLLSGFVLSVVYASERRQAFNSGKFWVARFARIYPIYFLSLLFSYYLSPSEPLVVLLNLTLTQAWSAAHAVSMNNPGWSLSVEMFFYLMFPLILMVLTRKRLPIAVAVCIVSYAFLEYGPYYLVYPGQKQQILNVAAIITDPYFPVRNLPYFMIGATLGALLKFGLIPRIMLAIFQHPAIYIAVLFAWLFYMLPFVAIPMCCLILSLVQSDGPITKFFSGRFGVFLGEASYAVYILHYPLYIWYFNFVQPLYEAPEVVKFYLYIALLLVLSMVVFVAIETPCRKAIRWLGAAGWRRSQPDKAF
ncbi:hypothetical protein PS718_03691 [Pseudomonas fluorescens]|uniref:Acyltransferase 3 domain-containing protein n=1 Tax=Pseudomonas fluorescens TaxID=294 RepID=A0A5E7DAK0_PSEFL|nr:acyltransferase [Pseudomonas fluorescens]VVO14397.1 hypothetical protein PS718_03691 [Pseudomonas fluorescens]